MTTTPTEVQPEAQRAGAFRRVLGAPGVPALAISSVLARLPIGMAAIGLVLYMRHETGSFAAAGAAAGFAVELGAPGGGPHAASNSAAMPRVTVMPRNLRDSLILRLLGR